MNVENMNVEKDTQIHYMNMEIYKIDGLKMPLTL